jgi:putative toxin-antitoxin system antitoxin component (TIGR02293 family)
MCRFACPSARSFWRPTFQGVGAEVHKTWIQRWRSSDASAVHFVPRQAPIAFRVHLMMAPHDRVRTRSVNAKASLTGRAGATRKSPSTGKGAVKVTAPRKRLQRSMAGRTTNGKHMLVYRPSRGVDRFVQQIADANPMELIEMERSGVSPRFLADLAKRIGLTAARVYAIVGVSSSTVLRLAAKGSKVNGAAGLAAVGMAKLLGKAQAMVQRSTSPDARSFDVGKWFGQWIECPTAALGGRKPAELIATPTGLEVVSRILGAMESGAYQ